jgi:azurin
MPDPKRSPASARALAIAPLSRRSLLAAAAFGPLALAASAVQHPPQPGPLVDLLVESDGDLLTFRPKELTCHAGERVRLTFRNTGKYVSFEHNWVLILPGSFDAVTAAALAAGEEHGWLPAGDRRILAATPLCGKGKAAMVEFTAPKAGDYPFICSFPGHAQSMWGVLHVLPQRRRGS